MKYMNRHRQSNIHVKMTIATVGALAGDALVIGSGTTVFRALLVTDRITQTMIDDGAVNGFKVGEATVEILGCSITLTKGLVAAGGELTGAPCYWDSAARKYTTTASGNTFMGWYIGSSALTAGEPVVELAFKN